MSTPGDIVVRRLGPDDWQIYRDLRLTALRDSPWAFASTLAREQQFTEDVWRRRLSANCTVVAFRRSSRGEGGEEPVGIAVGHAGEGGAELFSMWVAPEARGSGAADALIGEVCRWAEEEAHVTLALWVVTGNDVAERVYARNGFLRTGRVQPGREGEGMLEHEMIRLLGSA